MTTALYDTDFLAWTEEQAAALRRAGEARVNAPVDWQAVAEEIKDLGRSQKSAFVSFLRLIILHLLKLEYSRAVEPREHWRREIDYPRVVIRTRMADSPSLKSKIHLDGVYKETLTQARLILSGVGVDSKDVPTNCRYAFEDLIDIDWWPENRHGLD